MNGFLGRRKGSGLIIALCVLAMLAIMATTFITLMRLDTRVTANYLDDCRSEMLARGVLNYFNGILRNDLDRTWGKYANRNASVGIKGSNWAGPVFDRVPGINTYLYGTYICSDFWFNAPSMASPWMDEFGGIFTIDSQGDLNYTLMQQSFACKMGNSTGVIARHWDAVNNREYDAYNCLSMTDWDSNGRFVARYGSDGTLDTHFTHVGGVDFDADGNGVSNDRDSLFSYYYDAAPLVLFAGETYFFPGERLTGSVGLPGGARWRWGVKLGIAQSCFLNFNSIGNLDGADSAYLDNMGSVNSQGWTLHAKRSCDEAESGFAATDSAHLGRIAWKGFGSGPTGEYDYMKGGFPRFYNEVSWHPSQISMERLFRREYYPPPMAGADMLDLQLPRGQARRLVAYRWGNGTGKPADGSPKWRVGWRRDGATYYKFPSPENPMDSDRYFGAGEAMEHAHSAFNPSTSAVINQLALGRMDPAGGGYNLQDAIQKAASDWRKLKPYATMWSSDTILRGKIWPTEGPPYTSTQGDWRNINILKRVNLNIIGASGPEGISGEDTPLKNAWAAKALAERDRLYYMLVACLRFTNTPNPQLNACQFIASLTDMIDRDQNETWYPAPDGSAFGALGVEKHPVINEIAAYLTSANTAGYLLNRLRIELYNPMENIPWIPDSDEAYDIKDYVLRIEPVAPAGSPFRTYRLGDLKRFTTNPDTYYADTLPGNIAGAVATLGADGMFGDPADVSVDKKTWKRFAHVGWAVGVDWPPGLTKLELEGRQSTSDTVFQGVKFSLWKPLTGNAALNVPLVPGKVEPINGVRSICVDYTENLKLVKPYTGAFGPSTSANYVGIYRRWDPMNARVFGTQGTDQTSNVYWFQGYTLANMTLGRPNTAYPVGGAYTYKRHFERNFKLVDGDLPTIGWLGELMMWNCARNGPFTWAHTSAQDPNEAQHYYVNGNPNNPSGTWQSTNRLDLTCKFDLFRPFYPVGKYTPLARECDTRNLQMLDIFTVWDPSNDNIDNDGDGQIDDLDTGTQAGDRCGPEIQIYGLVDLNQAPPISLLIPMPDNKYVRDSSFGNLPSSGVARFCNDVQDSRGTTRKAFSYNWGPFETIGDMIRGDAILYSPATYFTRGTAYEQSAGGAAAIAEIGQTIYNPWSNPPATGDDDGDGIADERDERDAVFSWISNYFTTRSGLFDIDIVVDTGAPPYYPSRYSTPLKLPAQAYKSTSVYARKQVLAILDRTTCLRVRSSDGFCDFSGPIDVRMLRFTDEKKVY